MYPAKLTLSTAAMTAPTAAQTLVLYTVPWAGFCQHSCVHRVNGTIKHDAAGTLQLQTSLDGVTYVTEHEEAMAGSATEGDAFDFYIAPYYWWRIQFVDGGTGQATWNPQVALTSEASPTQ